MEMASSVRELMHQGGWVMWALLIFSLVALTTAFERGLTLRRSRLEIGPFLSRLHQALHDRRSVAAALKVCDAEQGSIARVAEAALRRFSQPGAQLEKRLEHQAGVEVRRLRSGLGVLATAEPGERRCEIDHRSPGPRVFQLLCPLPLFRPVVG